MALRDYRRTELIVAALVALPVPLVAVGAVALSGDARDSGRRAIDPGAAVPIRVKPVLDLDSPLAKAGGGRARLRMPKAWMDPLRPADATHPPSDGGSSAQLPAAVADPVQTTPGLPSSASSTGATDPRDSGVPADGNGPTTTGDPTAPPGPGVPGGDPNGDPSADPRKRNAARRYLGRIVAWFTGRFHATCDRLTPDERVRFRAVAKVTLDADGTVRTFSMVRSGHPAIDEAAERAMESAQGQQIPPPPEDFPELRPSSTTVTFVCSP